jgi:hypothetical protein
MRSLIELEKAIATLNRRVSPIADRPVDITKPGWLAELRQHPHPFDEVGIRAEAEALLTEIVQMYAQGSSETRRAIRNLFMAYHQFSWAATLSLSIATPEGFRTHLLLFSIQDQGHDTRDAILSLQTMCQQATAAGVKIQPILKEIAELSSDQDKYGMGTTKDLLLNVSDH